MESHDVLVLDVSGSMADNEIIMSFQGVAGHYLSDEARVNYESGICTAVTPVFFGTRAISGDTHIICSEKDAHDFLNANIDTKILAAIRAEVGGDTYPIKGLQEANLVYKSENALNIEPRLRRIVMVGDSAGGGCNGLCPLIETLSSEFGATVSAVAFGGEGLQKDFIRSYVTPIGSIQFVSGYNHEAVVKPIAAGVSLAASNPAEAKNNIQTILALSGY